MIHITVKKRNKAIISVIVALGTVLLLWFGISTGVTLVDRRGGSATELAERQETVSGTVFWRLKTGAANAWLLPCDGGWFLIDTGYPEDYERFLSALAQAGIYLKEIKYLFLTHAHDDHAGFAARFRRESGARLILPRLALAELALGRFAWNGVTVNPLVDTVSRLYNLVKRRTLSYEPLVPLAGDFILDESNTTLARSLGLPGNFVRTPGHSADSWSLVLDDGSAFVGDAAMNFLNILGAGYRPIFMEDRREVYRSMERLLAAGAARIYSGHGAAFPADRLPVVRDRAASGPGIQALVAYAALATPGLLLLGLLLYLTRKLPRLVRIPLYLLGFILIRDLMTRCGFWSFGSSPAFWLRFAADSPLLLLLALGSLGLAGLVLLLERGKGKNLVWFRKPPLTSLLAGVAGALAVSAPLLLYRAGMLPAELGGRFPLALVPALLSIALAGNFLEELLFRGYLQSELENQGLGANQAALTSGLMFGFCHVFLAYTVTEVGLPLILFATWEGIICGFLNKRFGLVTAVLTHGGAIALLGFF